MSATGTRTSSPRFAHNWTTSRTSAFPVVSYEPYIALAERLNAVTPGTHDKRTVLVNSGAEAIENAVKIARAHSGRQAVVCFEHAFHGRTNLAMAHDVQGPPVQDGIRPIRTRDLPAALSVLLPLLRRAR